MKTMPKNGEGKRKNKQATTKKAASQPQINQNKILRHTNK
jgi:hypothetical protein